MSRHRVGRRQLVRVAETLSDRDWALLASLAKHRFLTTRHIETLHFHSHASPLSAARAARRVLARLHQQRIVTHLDRRVGGVRAGSASYVWTLGPVGDRMLRRRQGEDRSRRRVYEPSATFLDHTLAVADAHVALLQAERDGVLELVTVEIEPACWRTYLGAAGQTVTLRPDMYVVTAAGEFEDSWFIEVDRGTEHLPTLLDKCRAYAAYRASGREQAERGVFPRVVWSVPDQRRYERLNAALDNTHSIDRELFSVVLSDELVALLATGDSP